MRAVRNHRWSLAADALSSLALGSLLGLVPALLLLFVGVLAYRALATPLGLDGVHAPLLIFSCWLAVSLYSVVRVFREARMRAADGRGPVAIRFSAPIGRPREAGDDPASRKASDVCECLARHLACRWPDLRAEPVERGEACAAFDAARRGARVRVGVSVAPDDASGLSARFAVEVWCHPPGWLSGGFDFAPGLALRAEVEDEVERVLQERAFDPVRSAIRQLS